MRALFLLTGLLILTTAAARADSGVTLGLTFPVVEHYGPSIDIDSSGSLGALQAAFEVKPKLALGVLVAVRQSDVHVPATTGKLLDAVTTIPVNALAYYHPLEKLFDPYLVGQIGPVFVSESFRENGTASSSMAVGPMLGFGAGAAFRLPVSPLVEMRCELGLLTGARVKNLAFCGAMAGIAVAF